MLGEKGILLVGEGPRERGKLRLLSMGTETAIFTESPGA